MGTTLDTPDSRPEVPTEQPLPTVGVAILHMGDRPAQLRRALETLRVQESVELDVVLVGNGWRPDGLPEWVRTVHVPENIGIPAGRNLAAREAHGEFIYFYDDDAALPTTDVLARLSDQLRRDERVAVVQPRGVDPDGMPSPRRWVPRFDVRGGGRPGSATWFWEAAVLVRRKAFEDAGGWPGQFFFAHEGIDLAWRLLDRGWRIEYAPSIVVHHPATPAARHEIYYRTNARNRVWVARRNLPAVLVPVYLVLWTLLTIARIRDPRALRTWFGGFREGLRADAGERRPMAWRTVIRLALAGRPPVV